MLRSNAYCTSLLVSLGTVASMYAASQHLDISGPIATVVAGLLQGIGHAAAGSPGPFHASPVATG